MKKSILVLSTLLWAGTSRGPAWSGITVRDGTFSAPATIELTLRNAETMALEGNPRLRASDARADAASKRVLPALLPADPVLMYDNSTPGMEQIMVEENFGFPGKGIAQADIQGAEAGRMRADASESRRETILQARRAYWEFYFRQKVDGILQSAEKNWSKLSQVVQSKELSGQWISIKAVRTQMETAKAANELITNSQALRVSRFNLNHLFSLPHQTAYLLGREPSLPPFEGKEEALVGRALGQSPEIVSYRRELDAQDARHTLAALDHLPDFNLRLVETKEDGGSGFSDMGFRIGVSIPLFFPAKQTQELNASADELRAAGYDLKGKQNEVIHRVEEAYVNADSSWRILRLYEEGGLLKQTERAWKATQSAYRNEQMSLTDYVETYNIYLETLTNYYRAQADYGKALAELEYQAGSGEEADMNPFKRRAIGGLFLLALAVLAAGIIHGAGPNRSAAVQAEATVYTCVMHHQIRRDKPGDCPLCGMTLVPVVKETPSTAAAPTPVRKVKYWANPMSPAQHSDKPMKDDMGMDYVPVYGDDAVPTEEGAPEALRGLAEVRLSPYQRQLVGLRTVTARIAPITRTIHTVGRFAGGESDFAAMAGDFTARKKLRSSKRFLIADVYALDLLFVKTGQKAVVTSLDGSGGDIAGRVTYIYPEDGTQSRVTRVRVDLDQALPRELFANVDIQATTEPRLAVPPTAVMNTGDSRYVFVQTSPGAFSPRRIEVGYEGNDLWEVRSGLREGDRVVDGADFLIDADSKLKAAFSEDK